MLSYIKKVVIQMDLLKAILNCNTLEEIKEIITKAIAEANTNSTKIEQLGFLDYGKYISTFKGFIPLNTTIKYESMAITTYNMQTTDYFYEFALFIKKYNVTNKITLIYYLEKFINIYFGRPGQVDRNSVLSTKAWSNATNEDELFTALDNLQLGDFKGKNAAMCTERAALVQQILSLFNIESYYCLGCLDNSDHQEVHAFNIVKRKNDYALLDYSIPVASYKDNKITNYYPFVGILSSAEFNDFLNNGTIKEFKDYDYYDGKQKYNDNKIRTYVVGELQIEKPRFNKF